MHVDVLKQYTLKLKVEGLMKAKLKGKPPSNQNMADALPITAATNSFRKYHAAVLNIDCPDKRKDLKFHTFSKIFALGWVCNMGVIWVCKFKSNCLNVYNIEFDSRRHCFSSLFSRAAKFLTLLLTILLAASPISLEAPPPKQSTRTRIPPATLAGTPAVTYRYHQAPVLFILGVSTKIPGEHPPMLGNTLPSD